MKSHKTYFNWSSGKDSMLALHYLATNPNYKIDRLVTTVNGHYGRVSMHGLRKELLVKQAEAIGIELDILEVPENPTMDDYNRLMNSKVEDLKDLRYTHTVFGDIFLEDLKTYRENMLKPLDIRPVFPLWKKDTTALINEFIDLGYKAMIICVNTSKLDESFLGETLTKELIQTLPKEVDPCGENGEYHTFCYDGPLFQKAVAAEAGARVFKHYDDPFTKGKSIQFGFCDITV